MLGKRLLQSLPKASTLTHNPKPSKLSSLKRPMPGALIGKKITLPVCHHNGFIDVMPCAREKYVLEAELEHWGKAWGREVCRSIKSKERVAYIMFE